MDGMKDDMIRHDEDMSYNNRWTSLLFCMGNLSSASLL